jgi:hypothetical protein
MKASSRMTLGSQQWEKIFFHSCYTFPQSSALLSIFESIRYFFRSFAVRWRISVGQVVNLPTGKSRGGATTLEPPDNDVVQNFLATLWFHKDKGTTFQYPGSTYWEISPSQVAQASIIGIGHFSHESRYFKKYKVTDEFFRCVIVFKTIKSGTNSDFMALYTNRTNPTAKFHGAIYK